VMVVRHASHGHVVRHSREKSDPARARRLDSHMILATLSFRRFYGQAEDDIPLQFISRPMPEVDMIANDTKTIKLPTDAQDGKLMSESPVSESLGARLRDSSPFPWRTETWS